MSINLHDILVLITLLMLVATVCIYLGRKPKVQITSDVAEKYSCDNIDVEIVMAKEMLANILATLSIATFCDAERKTMVKALLQALMMSNASCFKNFLRERNFEYKQEDDGEDEGGVISLTYLPVGITYTLSHYRTNDERFFVTINEELALSYLKQTIRYSGYAKSDSTSNDLTLQEIAKIKDNFNTLFKSKYNSDVYQQFSRLLVGLEFDDLVANNYNTLISFYQEQEPKKIVSVILMEEYELINSDYISGSAYDNSAPFLLTGPLRLELLDWLTALRGRFSLIKR